VVLVFTSFISTVSSRVYAFGFLEKYIGKYLMKCCAGFGGVETINQDSFGDSFPFLALHLHQQIIVYIHTSNRQLDRCYDVIVLIVSSNSHMAFDSYI